MRDNYTISVFNVELRKFNLVFYFMSTKLLSIFSLLSRACKYDTDKVLLNVSRFLNYIYSSNNIFLPRKSKYYG